MAEVVVLGSYNRDIAARVPRFPAPGETLHGSALLSGHGGKGSNQAVAAARAGAAVCFAGCLGADAAGEAARALWQAEGIASVAATHPTLPTGTALILVSDAGENEIVVIAGANHALPPEVAAEAAARLRAGGVALAQLETPLAPTLALFRAARAAGATTVLNTAPIAGPLPDALLEATDILIANAGEAAALCGTAGEAPALARLLARRARRAAVVTAGADGAFLADAEGTLRHQPAAAITPVDTTGAGDAFTGAFCAALARGDSFGAALADGVAAGALACLVDGAVAALPGREAIAAMRARLPPQPA